MRSTYRSFMAVILFTVAAGASLSLGQEPNPAPPPQAPPAVQPAGELQQIPTAPKPEAPPAEGQPAVAPVAKHAARKASSKPAAKPVIDVTAPDKTAAPAASVVAVEPPAHSPNAEAAPVAAPAIADPNPAPALKPAGDPVNPETKSDRTMGFGGWALFGIGVVGLFLAITTVRRRMTAKRHRSITDFSPTTAEVKLQPELARRS